MKNDCGPDIYLSFIQSFDHMIELDPKVWSFHTYLPPILKTYGSGEGHLLHSGPSFGYGAVMSCSFLFFYSSTALTDPTLTPTTPQISHTALCYGGHTIDSGIEIDHRSNLGSLVSRIKLLTLEM